MAILIPPNPSAFLPPLVPPPPPTTLSALLLRLQELFAPQRVVVILGDAGQDAVANLNGLDGYETDYARGWLGRVVSLGTRQLSKSGDEGEEWDSIVELSSSLVSALSGDGGTLFFSIHGRPLRRLTPCWQELAKRRPRSFFPPSPSPSIFAVRLSYPIRPAIELGDRPRSSRASSPPLPRPSSLPPSPIPPLFKSSNSEAVPVLWASPPLPSSPPSRLLVPPRSPSPTLTPRPFQTSHSTSH